VIVVSHDFIREKGGEGGEKDRGFNGGDRIFGNGDAIFMRNWPYAWNLLETQGSAVKGKVGIAPLPAFPPHQPAATLGGWHLGVNRFSQNPKKAELLVRFLTSPETQKWMALQFGYHPTRMNLYRDPDLLSRQPTIEKLYDVFMKARSRPVTPFYLTLSQTLQPEFSAVITGTKTPAEALQSAEKQLSLLSNEAF